MGPRHPFMELAHVPPCMVARHLSMRVRNAKIHSYKLVTHCFFSFCRRFFLNPSFSCSQEAVLLTMAPRLLYMMGAGRQVRAALGTPTIQTHHHGKKQSVDRHAHVCNQTIPHTSLHLAFLLFTGLMTNMSLPMTTSPLRLLKAMAVHPTLRLLATQKCPPRRSTLSTILRLLGLLPCEGSIRCTRLLFYLENILNWVFLHHRYNTDQYSPYAAPSPQGSYQPSPSPSPQTYHQVAPSPVGYQNTHSPASYHPTPSPMAYQVQFWPLKQKKQIVGWQYMLKKPTTWSSDTVFSS